MKKKKKKKKERKKNDNLIEMLGHIFCEKKTNIIDFDLMI